MPSANYQTKLTADTSQHDQALSRSAKQVYDYKKSCESTDKGVGKLLGTFKKFAGALGVAKIAGDTFKGMLENSTTAADNYGSMMMSLNRVTDEFQRSLVNLDFSNLWNGLGDVISRANEYYNALDNLQTLQLSLIGDNAKLNSELEEARRRYKAGDESAAEDIRRIGTAMANNVKEEREALRQELEAYTRDRSGVSVGIRGGGTIDKTAGDFRSMDDIHNLLRNQGQLITEIERARQRWMNLRDKLKSEDNQIYSNWVEVAQLEAEYKSLKKLQEQMGDDEGLKHFEENYARYYQLEGDYQRAMARVDQLLRKDEGTGAKTKRTIKVNVDPVLPEGSIAALEKKISDLKHSYSLAITDEGENGRNSLKKQIEEAEEELKKLKGEMNNLPAGSLAQWKDDLKTLQLKWELATTDEDRAKIKEAMDKIQAEINRINGVKVPVKVEPEKGSISYLQKLIAEKKQEMERSGDLDFIIKCKLEIEGLEAELTKLSNATKTPTEEANESIAAMQERYKQLGEDGEAAAGVIASAFKAMADGSDEGTARILNGFATITQQIAQMIPSILSLMAAQEGEAMASGVAGAAKVPYPANIAAIASIVAQLLAVFGTIASISKYADGGIIGGNSRIGDMNIARVNAGEMILNGRQQAKLFHLLNGNTNLGSGNEITGNVRFEIEGTKLVGVLGNYNRKISRVKP